MRKSALLVVLAAMWAGMLTGCVAQSEADRWQALYRRTQTQVEDLKARLAESQARIAALEGRRPEVDPATLEQLEQVIAERDRLAQALQDAEARLRELGSAGPILPPELDQALLELANANPELISYDPAAGMVKFRSDLTFASGSAEVRNQAVTTLNKLAQIIKAPIAQPYELRIVGHTDDVPINRGATKALHPTNWHLSVHRAIAVKDVFARAGVPEVRMNVAGYGEWRPVTPNLVGPGGKSRGAEANRRVEIYLVPSTLRATGPAPADGEVAVPAPAPAAPAPAPAEQPAEMFK